MALASSERLPPHARGPGFDAVVLAITLVIEGGGRGGAFLPTYLLLLLGMPPG